MPARLRPVIAIAIVLSASVADARRVQRLTHDQLFDASDLVAIGIVSDEVEKTGKVPNDFPIGEVTGVTTSFQLSLVLKGSRDLKSADVVHFVKAPTAKGIKNGPRLMAFPPKESPPDPKVIAKLDPRQIRTGPRVYLMFLKKFADDVYVPTTGQYDAVDSFRELLVPTQQL